MRVRVVDFDATWAKQFEDESSRILATLREIDATCHHIGSTAVPGLRAKPIIDMLLVVPSLSELDRQDERMQGLGYQPMGELGIPGRRYYRKSDDRGDRSHQIHAFARGSVAIDRHLAFRDYLRSHSKVAQRYAVLKAELAMQYPDDIEGYMAGKDAFIKEQEALALAWWTPRRPLT